MPPRLSASSTSRPRISDTHTRRFNVFVEIPPSPIHIERMTPFNTPISSLKTMPADVSRWSTPQASPNKLKRKLESYIEIPPSPSHRSTPAKTPKPVGVNTGLRRKSQVFVEIPASPLNLSRKNSVLSDEIRGSPLSTKAINSNIPVDTQNKKRKLSNAGGLAKQVDTGADLASNLSGYSYCHQCHQKCSSNMVLHCTTLSPKKCNTKYCANCLMRKYGLNTEVIKQQGATQWACPRCLEYCNCIKCRKAKGLPSAGRILEKPQAVKANIQAPTEILNKSKTDNNPSASAPNNETTKPTTNQIKWRPKKPVLEPKWNAIPTELNYSQVEDRFFLREFIIRFSTLMPKISATHLEELDRFDTLSRPCAKALIYGLLDLIGADAEPQEQKIIRETLKKISNVGSRPAALWAYLKALREELPNDFFAMSIPDPAPAPPSLKDDSDDEPEPPAQRVTRRGSKNAPVNEEVLVLDNGVAHAIQLLPPILALCECALQGASVREEIDEGCSDARGVNRSYFADLRKENDRWSTERASFKCDEEKGKETKGEGKVAPKKGGKPKTKGTEKDEAYRKAYAAHKATISTLDHAHALELQNDVPRFGPLGRDSQGRVYYAASTRQTQGKRSKPKVPENEDREEFRKWGWFLAVYGRGGLAKPSPSASDRDDKQELWWGFKDPAEVRQLAKWLAAAEGVDGKESIVEGLAEAQKYAAGSHLAASGIEQGPPSRSDVKALVKCLDEYADLLAWRLGG